MTDFVTHDSGSMSEYGDGMRRDATTGKPMFSLMFPKGVPYDEQMITRLAALYARGAEKYGARNHEKSSTEESLAHHEDAFLRHVFKFLLGVEDGEDHGAAVLWNTIAIDLTRRNIQKSKKEARKARKKAKRKNKTWKDYGLDYPQTFPFPLPDEKTVAEAKRIVAASRHDAFCPALNRFNESDCTCGLDGER